MTYEFNAERWLRNWSARKRFLLGDGRDPFAMCADEIHRLRMAVDLHEQGAELMRDEAARLKGELAALKGAAGALISDVDEYFRCADIGESRDKLAALVGEE